MLKLLLTPFKWLVFLIKLPFKWLGSLVDSNEKQIKKMRSVVDEINGLEPGFEKLLDADLKAKTSEFKARVAEATEGLRNAVTEAQAALEEARKRTAEADSQFEWQAADEERKRLEERAKQADNDLRDAESGVLEELLPEAFAAVREAAKRTLKQRHFDAQMMGGMVLHHGRIAEMKTGEGKTLVATLPLYLNTLTGRGCHLVTVNDYLSKRDPHWMGPVFAALGVAVGSIQHEASFLFDPSYEATDKRWSFMKPVARQEAYQAEITYGTNNEFGFDYLRDNMVVDLKQCVQRPLNFAIVDEVDNILIDEARTPLIISGPAEEGGLRKYSIADGVARQLKGKVVTDKDEQEAKFKQIDIEEGQDYIVNEKTQTVRLTEEGVQKAMRRLNVTDSDVFQGEWAHNVRQAIRANEVYKKNVEYVVKDGQVVIVDEFTGRLMFGRRYSEGLHQAIEAKEMAAGERVRVKEETRTYATITFQNYFRMYNKLAGMTGTALTEAEEFHKIYKLEVVAIPTNKQMVRKDLPDQVYKDEDSKFKSVVKEVEEQHKLKRPILIGTVSVEKSEMLEGMLKRRGVDPSLLNAKNHEREADIIAEAGKPGAVMVATNMAGRGVDIILGGKEPQDPVKPQDNDPALIQEWEKEHKAWEKQHEEWQARHQQVVQLGGLHVIGTERHEARRIDNQLRGRAGRQGDPGSSRFYVSLEDDVMRRFGGDRIRTVMNWAGVGGEDVPIENKIVSGSIESAQVRVEGYHFDIRKHLVEYDDVVNTQRELIYKERRKVLSGADLKANILSMIRDEFRNLIAANTGEDTTDDQRAAILAEANTIMPLPKDLTPQALETMKPQQIEDLLARQVEATYALMEQALGHDTMRMVERIVMLQIIDKLWVQHLTSMDEMREGVALQAVAQRDPLVAYKTEGSQMFGELLQNIRHDVAHTIFHVNVQRQPQQKQPARTVEKHAAVAAARPVAAAAAPVGRPAQSPMARAAAASRGNEDANPTAKVGGKKVGRNDPCPCGSGKKYKHCCGA